MELLNEYGYLVIPGIIVLVIVFLGLAFMARYKTVGPDEAMIVTGTFLGNKNISDELDESGAPGGRKIKIVLTPVSTQVDNRDTYAELFDNIRRINTILLGL